MKHKSLQISLCAKRKVFNLFQMSWAQRVPPAVKNFGGFVAGTLPVN
jgi:hypothetical protein